MKWKEKSEKRWKLIQEDIVVRFTTDQTTQRQNSTGNRDPKYQRSSYKNIEVKIRHVSAGRPTTIQYREQHQIRIRIQIEHVLLIWS